MILDRLLDSYMEKPKGQWRWESFYNNWVAVCAGCLGSMALFLLDDDKEKQQAIVNRVCETLPDYLAGMYEDGTCPEGMSYFTYGMTFYTGFARQLYEHTNGKIALMDSKKVRAIARFQQKCYLPGKNTVSFSDGARSDRFRLGLTCYLAKCIDGVEIPDISAAMDFESDHCYRFMGNWQDDAWVQEYLQETKEKSMKKKIRYADNGTICLCCSGQLESLLVVSGYPFILPKYLSARKVRSFCSTGIFTENSCRAKMFAQQCVLAAPRQSTIAGNCRFATALNAECALLRTLFMAIVKFSVLQAFPVPDSQRRKFLRSWI
ncbi:MAG: hypothetical protein IJ390_01745 [Lachnospiraceae bacterium]|nr:hypothetical protein [Lachnospiraceae bacterium]